MDGVKCPVLFFNGGDIKDYSIAKIGVAVFLISETLFVDPLDVLECLNPIIDDLSAEEIEAFIIVSQT